MFDYLPYVKPIDKKDYIIIYTYPNRIRNKKEIDAIKRFAHKYNKNSYLLDSISHGVMKL